MSTTNETPYTGLTVIKDSQQRWQVCKHDKTTKSFETFETLGAAMAYAYSLFTFNS